MKRGQKFSLYHQDEKEEAHRRWMAPYADLFLGCKRVLDVGCGPGTFLALLQGRGIGGLGIDYDAEMIEHCRKRGLEAEVADARTLQRFQGEFDGIHAGHVIEHMAGEQAVAFLEACFDALAPGGKLLIRTPNWENETVRNGGFWLDHTHVRPYPLPLLERIFEDLGLTVSNKGVEPFGWNDLFIMGVKQPAALQAGEIAVCWEGDQFAYHSLAHVNREIVSRLIESGEFQLGLVPYGPAQFGPGEDARLGAIARHLHHPISPDVYVCHRWPPRFEPPLQGVWVSIQPWEFGGIPAEWLVPMRDLIDEIWVPTSYVRECYLRSGIPSEKVVVIPNGVNVERYAKPSILPLATRKKFKFLYVGGVIERKGIDILLDTYIKTFSGRDDVCLVIKGYEGLTYQGGLAKDVLARYRANPDFPEIEYLDRSLTDDEMAGLYAACDCLVHPYRGEGFGMPIAEAMASALPVIVTGYGACLDFCDDDNAYLIPAREIAVNIPEFPNPSIGFWLADPDREALAWLMREVVAHPERAKEKGRKARARILESFQWEQVAERVVERLRILAQRTPVRTGLNEVFIPGGETLPIERKRVAFFHHPDWSGSSWREVVLSYAEAFRPDDDVSLVLWLDPSQGLSEGAAGERIMAALEQAGFDLDALPDLLLVPDPLDRPGLASLYRACNWIVPAGDPLAIERANKLGKPILPELSTEGWRAALDSSRCR